MSIDDSKKAVIERHSKKLMVINSSEVPEKIIVFVSNKKGGMDRHTFVSLPRNIE